MKLVTIDDQADVAEIICQAGKLLGWDCYFTTDPQEFMELTGNDADVIFIDLMMPGVDGVEMLRWLADWKSRAQIVLISGFDVKVLKSAEQLAKSLGLRTLGHLEKPFRLAQINEILSRAATGSTTGILRKSNTPLTQIPQEEIYSALAEDRVIPYFQIQIDLKNGKPWGSELLIRIGGRDGVIIPPMAFIPIAEENRDLIGKLTDRVLSRGFQIYRKMAPEDWTISINLSPRLLDDLVVPDRISTLAKENGLSENRVVIEVTETGLINNLGKALDILTRLRIKGFELSIDDYGTGYSSMAQLKNIPATELKIDKIFVSDLESDTGSREMVKKTIELAHQLNLKVVAEGIETTDQERILRELNCNFGQGYLYSKPVPIEELMKFNQPGRTF